MNYKTFSLSWFSFRVLYLVFSLDGIHVCNLLMMGFLMNYFVDVQPGYSAGPNSLEDTYENVGTLLDASY